MSGLHHRMRRAVAGGGGGGGYTAKSVVFDMANGWGNVSLIGVRSIEFTNPTVITNNATLASFYGGAFYPVANAFTTGQTKIGNANNTNTWFDLISYVTNRRIICVFNTETDFSGIQVNNAHESGGSLDWGIKDTKIYVTPDVVTNIAYGTAVPNGTLIFDGTVAQHIAANEIDDQVLTLI